MKITKILVASCLVTAATAETALEVDAVFHWDGATIDNPNPGSSGTLGAWEQASHTRLVMVTRTNALRFPNTPTVNGVPVTGDGTNWVQSSLNAGTGYDFATYNFSSSITNLAVAGFFMHTTPPSAEWESLDLVTMSSSGVGYSVFNVGLSGSANPIVGRVHTEVGHGAGVALTAGKTYLYVLNRNTRSGWASVRFFDPTNSYALVGESSINLATNSTTWRLRIGSGYIGDVPGYAFFGPMLLIVEPTQEEVDSITNLNSGTLTLEAAQAIVDATPAGGVATFPAGHVANWTNTLFISTPIRALDGGGIWITNQIPTDTESPVISVHAPGVTVSNLFISGNGTYYGAGVAVHTTAVRVAYSGFTGLDVAVWSYVSSNLIDNCWVSEISGAGRHYGNAIAGGAEFWNTIYPLPWNSLRYTFWEDCTFTNSLNTGITWLMFSSGQGASYVVRSCDFYWSAPENYQAFDHHGDMTLTQRGTLGVQFYRNRFFLSNGAYSTTWDDFRGGEGLIYSNEVFGASQTLWSIARAENVGGDYTRDGVTNSYAWGNVGLGGITVKQDISTNYISEGVHFFNTAPSVLLAPPYPHPLRTLATSPTPSGNVGRMRGRALIRGTGVLRSTTAP